MDALSSTAQTLHAAMSQTGTVLPSFMVNDANRADETRKLELLAGLLALARQSSPDLSADASPDALYAALDAGMKLEQYGIFDFKELMELLDEAHHKAANPPFPLTGPPTAANPEGEPLSQMYGVDLSAFDGSLSDRKARVWVDLMAATLTLAQERYPWRVGTTRADHAEPFVPGRAPEEPTFK